tara:strand:+ start:1455 stop:2294 length:840 start_codon:yes stop_codon:yes gene_type:complete
MIEQYAFKSYSKINLGLKVLNERKDGFHNIESIFVELDFHDLITFKPSNYFQLTCNNDSVPIDMQNTISQSYQFLKNRYNFNNHFHVYLDKKIPMQSGLGGGSSNAACTLNALNTILDLKISKSKLHQYALEIGSDVPFFIEGGVKFVKGRGEKLETVQNSSRLQSLYFLIVIPKFSISTKWAYEKLKKALKSNSKQYKFPTLDQRLNWSLFKNDFEVVVKATYPEIMNIKEIMYNNGALYSGLSGTGSTVFGIYNEEKFIMQSQNKLSHYKTHRASPT